MPGIELRPEEDSVLKLILLIVGCLLALVVPLVWMILKFYWGPSGKPREYKNWPGADDDAK